ncbi:Aldo/keto reductase [Pholiota conissans]|uniref:Aldo/keto reductase n=1 Tax=Pholiota conissans TaxID=109636 RepID=A0A9P5Z0E0_9AGAR|nr:Aldo/keto reductase [Pholiota conissans]
MAIPVPSFTLNTGYAMPAIGIGCWMGHPGEGDHVVQMIKNALQLGYRHIDTAAMYGDEESVGRAIKESGIPRSEIFITTKLASIDHGKAASALDESLRKLGTNYVDLYLIHWPQAHSAEGKTLQPDEYPTYIDTWKDMETLFESGKVRSIGVSNFSIKTLTHLLSETRVVPAANQVELHPYLPEHKLLAFCRERGILLTAYAPIGRGTLSADETILSIAERHGVTATQVMLSWGVQRGTSVIPKTENPRRLKENFSIIKLTPEEMHTLNVLHHKPGCHHSACKFHSAAVGSFAFGWTYEQLGWDMSPGGIVIHIEEVAD